MLCCQLPAYSAGAVNQLVQALVHSVQTTGTGRISLLKHDHIGQFLVPVDTVGGTSQVLHLAHNISLKLYPAIHIGCIRAHSSHAGVIIAEQGTFADNPVIMHNLRAGLVIFTI